MKSPLPSTDRKSYRADFLEKCQDVQEEASEWMKYASSCGILATFIPTMAFARAFKVLVGNDSNTGSPIFQEVTLFRVFLIADGLALFFSVSTTLMFFGIVTSQSATDDFCSSLPTKLTMGLTFLFISVVCVLVAVGSAFTIVLSKPFEWIHISITSMVGLPLPLLTILLLP